VTRPRVNFDAPMSGDGEPYLTPEWVGDRAREIAALPRSRARAAAGRRLYRIVLTHIECSNAEDARLCCFVALRRCP
jgi:hypothetical protein